MATGREKNVVLIEAGGGVKSSMCEGTKQLLQRRIQELQMEECSDMFAQLFSILCSHKVDILLTPILLCERSAEFNLLS